MSYLQILIQNSVLRKKRCAPQSLWVAVVEQALIDALSNSEIYIKVRNKMSALYWIFDDGDDFKQVCSNAEIDHRSVQQCVWMELSSTNAGCAALEFAINRKALGMKGRAIEYLEMQRAIKDELSFLLSKDENKAA